MMGAGDDVGNELGFDRIGHRRFQDPYDDRGTSSFETAKADGLSNEAGIGVERAAPELVGKHGSAGRIWTIVVGREQASEYGVQSHDVEVVAIDDTGMDFARRSQAHDGEVDFGKCT